MLLVSLLCWLNTTLLILRQSTESWSRWRATVTPWVWLCSSSSGCSGTQTSPLSSDTPKCLTFTKMVILRASSELQTVACYGRSCKNFRNILRWKLPLGATCSIFKSKVIKGILIGLSAPVVFLISRTSGNINLFCHIISRQKDKPLWCKLKINSLGLSWTLIKWHDFLSFFHRQKQNSF